MERGGGNALRTGGMQCPSCSLSCLFGKTRSQHPCAPMRGDLLAPRVLAVVPEGSINELAIERSAARVPDIAS